MFYSVSASFIIIIISIIIIGSCILHFKKPITDKSFIKNSPNTQNNSIYTSK